MSNNNDKNEIEPIDDVATAQRKIKTLIKNRAYCQLKKYLTDNVTLETFPDELLNNMMLKSYRKVLIYLVLPCYLDKLLNSTVDRSEKVKAVVIKISNAIQICDMEQTIDAERYYNFLYQAMAKIANSNYAPDDDLNDKKEQALIATNDEKTTVTDCPTITVTETGQVTRLNHMGFRAMIAYCTQNTARDELLLKEIPLPIIINSLVSNNRAVIFNVLFSIIQDNTLYTLPSYANEVKQLVNVFKKHKGFVVDAISEYALIYLDGNASIDFLFDIYLKKKKQYYSKYFAYASVNISYW